MSRGYFGIGAYCPKTDTNIGTLLRSAQCFGADFTFVIGAKGLHKQASNTTKTHRHIPHYEYSNFEAFLNGMPIERTLIGIETGGASLPEYRHPDRAVYLLGREDSGLPQCVLERCNAVLTIPTEFCLNVAVAGSIALYDRVMKGAVS